MKTITSSFMTFLLSILGFSQTITLVPFGTNFSNPIEITQPTNDARLFVAQQGGLIRILNANGTVNATPFLNVSGLLSLGGERGLLGLAFHPNYATNGFFFINYTNTSGNTVIARYTVNTANPNLANSTSALILMTINQPYANHNGGCLRFGPDGFLYIGMGDGGSGGDPQGYSQNLSLTNTNVLANPSRIYLGKMLRIDVNTTSGVLNYGIPASNPFIGQPGKEEIWAYGLRNPWKFSFDRVNGDLWIADVGQNEIEEINRTTSPLPNNGLNYGWRCYEGNVSYNTSGCSPIGTMTMPITQYTHTATNGCSITGGFVYRGAIYPSLVGKYVFADYCNNQIGVFDPNTGNITWSSVISDAFITAFGEDNNGELYVARSGGGLIQKAVVTNLNNSEFDKNGFSLFPNPATSEFSIKNNNNIDLLQAQVYDLSGKLLLTQKLQNNTSIATTSLTTGMYLVTIEAVNGARYNTKLIVE